MGFVKNSLKQAVTETIQSKEFKESVKNIVVTSIDESSEVIEKIVTDKRKDSDNSSCDNKN